MAAEERVLQAAHRDETAKHRDLAAEARDRAADRRDRDSASERKMASRGHGPRTAPARRAEIRAQAANDRARAADDRTHAADDRRAGCREREMSLAARRRAHQDELTGAFRRGTGEGPCRARSTVPGGRKLALVLAFVDVDGLREINDTKGHSAGDAPLAVVVSAIQANIRSYEPVMRFGGDEFVFAMAGSDAEEAENRCAEIKDRLAAVPPAARLHHRHRRAAPRATSWRICSAAQTRRCSAPARNAVALMTAFVAEPAVDRSSPA